jgi:hypothetical protein
MIVVEKDLRYLCKWLHIYDLGDDNVVLLQFTDASETPSPYILKLEVSNVDESKISGLRRYVNKTFALLAYCAEYIRS